MSVTIDPLFNNFCLREFLTDAQKDILKKISPQLHFYISERFLSSQVVEEHESLNIALNIIGSSKSKNFIDVNELFFISLFKAKCSLKGTLDKLWQICQKGEEEVFFQCVSTKQSRYYSPTELVNIIDLFHQASQSLEQSLSNYHNFPPFDENGREELIRIQRTSQISPPINDQGEKVRANPLTPSAVGLDTLLQENLTLTKMHSLAINYLSAVPERNRLPMKIYLKFFNTLKDFTGENHLRERGKVLLIRLVVLLTTTSDATISKKYLITDLEELLEEVLQVHQKCGEETLSFFCSGIHQGNSLDDAIKSLRFLHLFADDFSLFSFTDTLIKHFAKHTKSLADILVELEDKAPEVNQQVFDEEDEITDLVKRFKGNDRNVRFPLTKDHLDEIISQYKIIRRFCLERKDWRIHALANRAAEISAKAKGTSLSIEDICELIAIGRLAIRIKFQIYLHKTQIFTVLGQLCYPQGCVAQVKTGEGKSMIVSLLAFVLALQHKSVHIVSSSRNLAIRDQDKSFPFFKLFTIFTTHICVDDRKEEHFRGDILYGTATDFEFALMEEMVYGKKLFKQKAENQRFDAVIVDELDNLTIDTARNGARLGYPAEVTYDWVYAPIYNFTKMNFNSNSDDISSEAIQLLRNFLQSYLDGRFQHLVKSLSDQQLEGWLKSALHAHFNLKENKNYIVGRKQTERSKNEKEILIVDAQNTGRIMQGSRWSKGIHEFVEIKHSINPKSESLTPLSYSHAIYYSHYRCLYGLTGTLGTKMEREEIRTIYKVDSFDVPTHKPLQRVDQPTILEPTKLEFLRRIIKIIQFHHGIGRPILVLCETIDDSLEIEKALNSTRLPYEMLNEIQQKNEEEILERAGIAGAITIATNNAGRGTDIILKGTSEANGGLHVLLTFYPNSQRVEEQARGRAGRQGQPGSSQMVISGEKLNLPIRDLSIDTVQNNLNVKRSKETKMKKHLHSCHAEIERFCFTYTQDFYDKFNAFKKQTQQDVFINRLAKALNDRKVYELAPNLDNLPSKDILLGKELIKLLTKKTIQTEWQTVMRTICRRIEEKALNHWCLKFYQKNEELVEQAGLEYSIQQQALIGELGEAIVLQIDEKIESFEAQEYFGRIDAMLLKQREEHLQDLKNSITVLFNEAKNNWEKYLANPIEGILELIRELIGIKLTNLDL